MKRRLHQHSRNIVATAASASLNCRARKAAARPKKRAAVAVKANQITCLLNIRLLPLPCSLYCRRTLLSTYTKTVNQ
mgnify:CR=1 FL=1